MKLLWPKSVKASFKRNFMRESERAGIGHAVLSYLTENAEAGDTLEGIIEWWLLERKIRHGSAEVREALDELAAKELISEYKGRDARVHYRINRRKEKEIKALVERRDW
jgi:hypothetical protein